VGFKRGKFIGIQRAEAVSGEILLVGSTVFS
jgi:hypothetical protein